MAYVDAQYTLNQEFLNNHNEGFTQYVLLTPFNFLIQIKVDGHQKLLFMAVQLLGTKISASKWSYKFHIYNENEKTRAYEFFGICHSNSASLEDVFEEQNCAVIPIDYLKLFANREGNVSYKFNLKKDFEGRRNKKQGGGKKTYSGANK